MTTNEEIQVLKEILEEVKRTNELLKKMNEKLSFMGAVSVP
jgi:hypothetical protein